MIYVTVDEFTPCLKNTRTGQLVQTEVIRIRRKSFLRAYSLSNGWYVDWADLVDENEIYALVVEGSVDIQGLVALHPDKEAHAMFVTWMVSNPRNNKLLQDDVDYLGVGGHLFAIAAQKSIECGFGGYFHGFAANEKLLAHYVDKLGATPLRMLHPNHFAVDSKSAKRIMEVYDYEYTDEEV